MARKLIVISNEVFFVLVFGCGLCFVLQVNGDGEYGGVRIVVSEDLMDVDGKGMRKPKGKNGKKINSYF